MPFCKVNDVKLYYEDYGSKDKTPLIFIHGLSLTGMTEIDNNPCSIWKPQIEHFKEKRRVVVFDLRGQGRSDKPQGRYSAEQFSADLFSLMKNLQLERAIIVGFSMGGTIALRFTLDHQEMVEKLILISTTSQKAPFMIRLAAPLWTRLASKRSLPANLKTPKYVIESCTYFAAAFDVTSELSNIKVPTLVIHGAKEAHGSLSTLSNAKFMKEHIPNAELEIIENAQHMHLIDMPEKTWTAIGRFIDTNP